MTREEFDEYVAERYETKGTVLAYTHKRKGILPESRILVDDAYIQRMYKRARMQWDGYEHGYVKSLCNAHKRHATTVFDFARASFVSGYIGVIEHRW